MKLRAHVLGPLLAVAVMAATPILPPIAGLDVHVSVSVGPRGMQWGLWEPDWQQGDGGVDWSPYTDMESQLGHHTDLVHWYASWSEGWSYDGPLVSDVLQTGRTPLITWEATGRPLQDIANGQYDSYIDSWAKGMAALAPAQIDLRIFHEFNDPYQGDGSGYSWGVDGGTGNTPAGLVAAWRHVHDRFRAAGATNVRFVWCPDGANPDVNLLRSSYPGDAYVDYAGWDQYDDYDVAKVYAAIGQVTQKPIIIPEYGETTVPPVTSLSDQLSEDDYDRIKAVVWFDDESWRLDDEPDVRTAVRQMLAGPAFTAPSPSPSPIASPSPVPSGSPSPSPSGSPSPAPSGSPSQVPSPSATPVRSPSPSPRASPSPSGGPSPSPGG